MSINIPTSDKNENNYQYSGGSPIRLINKHMYCADSESYKGDINSPWAKKYMYKHEDENGKIIHSKTNNICRHSLNDDSYHYGDIAIRKLKHNIGLDIERDYILSVLLERSFLPILNFPQIKQLM